MSHLRRLPFLKVVKLYTANLYNKYTLTDLFSPCLLHEHFPFQDVSYYLFSSLMLKHALILCSYSHASLSKSYSNFMDLLKRIAFMKATLLTILLSETITWYISCSRLKYYLLYEVQFSSVIQSCLALYNPMDCSTPGFPVHHQLLEPTQTYIYCIGDATQSSHPLSSPSPPTFNISQLLTS